MKTVYIVFLFLLVCNNNVNAQLDPYPCGLPEPSNPSAGLSASIEPVIFACFRRESIQQISLILKE